MRKHPLLALALVVPMAAAGVAIAAEEITASQTAVLKDNIAAPGTARVSKLIGTEVADPQGTDIGKIKDVVIAQDFTRVDYLVLTQAEGLVGAREKLVALPYKAIRFGSPAEERVYVKIDKQVLEKAPGFDDSKWPTQANADFYRSLDNYYNTQLESAMNEQAEPRDVEPAEKAAAQIGSQDLDWTRRASKLEDRAVVSSKGENLGKIADIVVDTQTGKITYAVLDGPGGNHAVPLNAFSVNIADKKLVLDTTREELKQTPALNEDRWPAKPDPRWSKMVPAQNTFDK